jgi:hypothetical protein
MTKYKPYKFKKGQLVQWTSGGLTYQGRAMERYRKYLGEVENCYLCLGGRCPMLGSTQPQCTALKREDDLR